MIDHLHIKNFLAFPELEVPELKQINLVAGKNNAGKTALLEAVWILTSDITIPAIETVSNRRKGRLKYDPKNELLNSKRLSLKDYSLFSINELEVEFLFKEGIVLFRRESNGEKSRLVDFNHNPFNEDQKPKNILILSRPDYSTLSKLWNKIALTEDEVHVLAALSASFDKKIVRISVTDEQVLLLEEGFKTPYNIESLGEGAKRILLLALALVNSRGNVLLIDEIETHLHHSVIRKLWKIIFEYAVKWNIQVVATTHSQDAIRQFWYEAAEKESYKGIAQVLRLQVDHEGKHEVIQFPFERLDSVMEMEMEIR